MPDPIPNTSATTAPATSSLPQPNPEPGRGYDLAAEPPWSAPTQRPGWLQGSGQSANSDCLALGCDWDWGTGPCRRCGQWHTFRICRRCLFSDDPVCAADKDHHSQAVLA